MQEHVPPLLFVTSGMKLEVAAIFGSPAGLALTGLFFVAVLAVRLPVALAYRGVLQMRQRAALRLTGQSVDRATARLHERDGL